MIDTCFGTHHLNFAEDANNTLWLSNNTQGDRAVVGWINTKTLLADLRRGIVAGLDRPDRRHQRQRQARRGVQRAGRAARLLQGHAHSVRHVRHCVFAGGRRDLGLEPHASRLHRAPCARRKPARDRDGGNLQGAAAGLRHPRQRCRSQGVVWIPLDSGHIASFDRHKCRGPLNGPGAELGGNVRRASHSIRSRARASRAIRAPRRTPITRGSISTTSSASATMCRSRPAISPIAARPRRRPRD